MLSENNNSHRTGLSPLALARIAGLFAIVVLACGTFAHQVNSTLIVDGDAVATARNVLASEQRFRLAFVSGLMMETVFIGYALLLYRLLKPVNRHHALAMLVLALVAVPIFMLNQVSLFAVLPLARDGMHEQMLFFLKLNRSGGLIFEIFCALWLFPLGLLVFRSGFLPRVFGILLMIGCFGYLIHFVQGFLFPGAQATLWTSPALLLTHLSELALMLWLLIRGVNLAEWNRRVKASGPG